MITTEAFTHQVQQMTPSLYRMGMGILHRSQDVEDAVQQALLKAWANKHKAQETYFKPWLMRIAINECRNIQRHRQRVVPGEVLVKEEPSDNAYEDIYMAMDALPEKMRLVLLLKYMENYSEKDIALALGITVGATKGRLFRAREALKRELQETGVAFE